MKDSNILYRTNKNLLFAVIVVVLVAIVGYYLFGRNNSQPAGESPTKEVNRAAEPTEENVAVPEENNAAVKPVRGIGADDHIWGDPNAPVKIIVYSDFECPFCARFFDTIEQVKKDFAGTVVIAFRQFPLLSTHIYALKAAEASECAAEQDKFWEMHDQLFTDNKADQLNEAQFKLDAKNLGLDTKKFDACLDSDKYKDKIEAQIIEAKDFNVNGTPTTFINGQIIVGAYPFEDFTASDGAESEGLKSIIEKQLNK